jgi:structural maintenance of chromosome 4
MELNQKLSDLAKDMENAQHAIDNFQTDHDKLRLHDIEYVKSFISFQFLANSEFFISDDDDDSDDEDEERREGSTPDGEEQEAGADGDGEAGPSRPRAKKDQELRVYGSEELRRLKHTELVADTELLDGLFFPSCSTLSRANPASC